MDRVVLGGIKILHRFNVHVFAKKKSFSTKLLQFPHTIGTSVTIARNLKFLEDQLLPMETEKASLSSYEWIYLCFFMKGGTSSH